MIKIETWNDNKILRNISEAIKPNEIKQYVKIGKEMIKYIKNPENRWVWLAAPQIWINKRLIVVSLLKDYEDKNFPTIMMLNPEILEFSKETIIDWEWCLSLPWEKLDIERAKTIKLKYLDDLWKERILILTWLPARIVQHEVDHLNWILFIDRAKGLKIDDKIKAPF